MTLATRRVLEALLEEPTKELYGLQLCDRAGLPSGTIYPILARLEDIYGWVIGRWEELDGNVSRPRRRYYRLSPEGMGAAPAALAKTQTRDVRRSAEDGRPERLAW